MFLYDVHSAFGFSIPAPNLSAAECLLISASKLLERKKNYVSLGSSTTVLLKREK